MGIIRGALLIFISVLLFVSLLLSNIFFTMSLSLQPEVVQPKLEETLKDIDARGFSIRQIIENNYDIMLNDCVNETVYSFSDDEFGVGIEIPCSVVAQGVEPVLDYSVNAYVEEQYSKEIDCNFFDCFGKTKSPMFLMSKKAQNYWQAKFYFFLVISLILFGGVMFFTSNKNNSFIVLGVLMIVSAIPLLKIEVFLSPIFNFILGFINLSNDVSFNLIPQISSIFFSKASTVFWIVFITGIVFLVLGFTFRLLSFSFKMSRVFGLGQGDFKEEKVVKKADEKKVDVKKVDEIKNRIDKTKKEIEGLKGKKK